MTALTNAERQRAYRARKRNAPCPGVVQADPAPVTPPMTLDAELEHRRVQAVCGQLNPYVLFCCAVKFGPRWLLDAGFSRTQAEAAWRGVHAQ